MSTTFFIFFHAWYRCCTCCCEYEQLYAFTPQAFTCCVSDSRHTCCLVPTPNNCAYSTRRQPVPIPVQPDPPWAA